MKELNLRVRGNVQGVFYRAAIHDAAEKLGLKGFARNEDDGSVTVKAQGPEEALQTLIEKAWKGSMTCEVENIEEDWKEAEQEFQRFQVL